MAKFTPKKIVLDEINYGNQFRDGDGITTEAINAPIEASAFAQAIATNPPDYTKAHLVGNPKVSIGLSGDGTPQLVFENLKGEKGEIPTEWGDAIKLNSKKISNLEAIISNDAFITETSKSVPSDVAPYAAIDKIGGMTYRDGNTLKHAKVKAIKSKGANLWNPYVTDVNAPGWVNKDTPKAFSENVWYQGLTSTSYWDSRNVSNIQLSNNKVSFYTTNGGYGMARAFKCKPNTAYVLSFDYEGDFPSGCSVGFYDASGNWLNYDWDGKDIVTPANCYWLTVTLVSVDYPSNCTFSNIMLAESDVEIPYTPYVGTLDTFSIPEAVQALEGYGVGTLDGNNHIYYGNNGRVYYSKPIKAYELTGDENWGEYGSTNEFFRCVSNCIDDSIPNSLNAICSHFSFGYSANCFSIDTGASRFSLRFAYDIFTNGETTTAERIETIRRWFKEQKAQGTPVTIVYPLQTPPADEDITDLMPIDNYIKVEGGGTIIADNAYEYAVPTTITYQKRG